MLSNPLKTLTKKEWLLWLASLAAVIISNFATNDLDLLTLISALLGVTSLIFAAKGSVWAQFLMIVFCILYGIISFRFHYWGEMITYLGMTLPMAAWSAITWLQNPSEENECAIPIYIGSAIDLSIKSSSNKSYNTSLAELAFGKI